MAESCLSECSGRDRRQTPDGYLLSGARQKVSALFLVLMGSNFSGELGKVPFLAEANKSLGKALELIPHTADVFGFIRCDEVVRCRFTDGGEQASKLLYDFLRCRHELHASWGVTARILYKDTIRLVTEPLKDLRVTSDFVELSYAIEWICRAAALLFVRL